MRPIFVAAMLDPGFDPAAQVFAKVYASSVPKMKLVTFPLAKIRFQAGLLSHVSSGKCIMRCCLDALLTVVEKRRSWLICTT